MEHKSIKRKNGTIHYWIHKKEGTQASIVFTHGLCADHTIFEKQIPYFLENYTLLLWDVPMHGSSRPYSDFSYRESVECLDQILQKEKIDQVFLVGMSMGGYPSQHFALIYPEKTKGLIGLDTTPLGSNYYSRFDEWWLKHADSIAKYFPSSLLRKSIAWSVSNTKEAYVKMRSILEPLSKAEITEQMQIAYSCFILENKDVQFSFPVLLLVGEKDRTGKVLSYNKAWAKRTKYPLHFIENARHFANYDAPDQVNQEIEAFIQRTLSEKR